MAPKPATNPLSVGLGPVVGVVLGLVVFKHIAFRTPEFPTWVVLLSAVVCAFMAVRYWDRFWGN
jgi:hypothetical protein